MKKKLLKVGDFVKINTKSMAIEGYVTPKEAYGKIAVISDVEEFHYGYVGFGISVLLIFQEAKGFTYYSGNELKRIKITQTT